MRARIVLLADRGYSSEKIGRRLRISRKAVERWRKRYISQRIAGLKDKNRSPLSKESGVLEVRRKRVLAILHEQPKLFGINRSSWTFDALAIAYQQRHGEKFSKSTMHRLVKMSGYSFKKARRVLTSPDPDYREKVELLLTTLRNLRGDEFLFFIDEMGPMRVKKYGGRSLVRKGETNTFPQQQKDKGSVIMSAALSATKNQVTWFYSPAKDTQAMIDLIEVLFNQHHTAGKLYLTWDAASWHSSAALVEWLDQFNAETVRSNSGPIIQIIPLPTSSQFLDVLEAVFSGMKRAVIHHSDYADKNAMKAAISKHFSDRNEFFVKNPRRAGKKIWELDFFEDIENIKSGNYREW
jgi:transposase